MAQRVHPKIIAKIHELVEAGISELPEVKRALKLYVTTLPQSPTRMIGLTTLQMQIYQITFIKLRQPFSYQNWIKRTLL